MPDSTLSHWFQTPLGAPLLDAEQNALDQLLGDIFGFHALQVGLTDVPMMRMSRIPHKATVAAHDRADIQAWAHELPIANESVDLVLLPHVLEFAENPHAILREIDRILVPEGRLIITGFNPWSLWGLRQSFSFSSDEHPWKGHFISLPRLKDWLSLLEMEVNAGKLWGYGLPIKSEAWRHRFRWLEAAGDRWWGIAGGVYLVEAIKRVHSVRPLQPQWRANRGRVLPVVLPAAREQWE